MTQLQKLAEQQQQQQTQKLNTGGWRWPGKRSGEEDDSWEVRAFAEDTSSALGTTWPPRSYTCTFCRREFRSAQALGGHMNVHRRDRARLRQSPHASEPSSSMTLFPPTMFQSPEYVAGGGGHGMCFFYPLPVTGGGSVFAPAIEPPSTVLSISPVDGNWSDSSGSSDENRDQGNDIGGVVEELDLELRLGCLPSSPRDMYG
ncbi:hypothetical protein J5N97_008315 [Dioscorea zingiberensis]|uniref:C2H2-type domain-containing protein n=1 Tax=Dioscorea zingiberensis TaxID=325984 RepID=A0A9D5HVK5_9LILI|nr:hypothetical protein J5N97_008315 [Dioscorea zingiberensis]